VIVGPEKYQEVVVSFKDLLHPRIDRNDMTISAILQLAFKFGAGVALLAI